MGQPLAAVVVTVPDAVVLPDIIKNVTNPSTNLSKGGGRRAPVCYVGRGQRCGPDQVTEERY